MFFEYISLRDEFKRRYMLDSDMLIDHHKVVAIFMISLLSVRPIKYLYPLDISDRVDWLLNENLAISMGLSILREFLFKKEPNNLAIQEYLKNGFIFPTVNHGKSYKENWALELYFGSKRNVLFTLSLANELFLIEYYNTESINRE
ncbi:hypothetical protein AGMMS50255_0240 [Spirochaetia bacterium]|nr:hypothetical protein AGMMS50255_0240 [Spirochaetia bacterium]